MKKLLLAVLLIGVLVGVAVGVWRGRVGLKGSDEGIAHQEGKTSISIKSNTMEISSVAFTKDGTVPVKYTCDGDNINPPLAISGVPEGSQSLVLIVDDPDAPTGTWTHWTVWNIKPDTKEIKENSVPEGSVQGTTSDGSVGYHGPCPPSGAHRYFFKLYALDSELNLDKSAKVDQLVSAMNPHVISQAELMGKYSR